MSDEARVLGLLAEMLDSGATPEEACRSCPEMLPQVRERWREVCDARAELDDLFPPFCGAGGLAARPDGTPLPEIAGYEVEAVLGQGGMGVAFRARHLGLNRVVALKMMLAGEYAGPRERERFRREAEAVAGLRHPNVVQVYDVGDAAGRPYFTMEYAEGGTLARKLDGTPLPPREAAELLATLAGAVHAAHRAGVVHRDLKPSNVLLTADGVPKVSDFGLARRLGGGAALTRTGAALGTPGYMAPEQAAGSRDAGEPAVDIYALGAVLYELLTGRPPFRAGTAVETVQQVLSRDPVPPTRLNPRVPRDLETVCMKCLRKEPALRYADADALRKDLDRHLRGEAIAARPEGRAERLARRVRRHPWFAASILAVALLAVGAAGGGFWLLSDRAATANRLAAERAAADRAAGESLRQMADSMSSSSWPEARAALERARGWLVKSASADLNGRAEQGGRDLDLADRLDSVRLTGFTRAGASLDFTRTDEGYEAAFRDAGLGAVGGPAGEAADRVKASHVRAALVSALDHWSVAARDPRRREWAACVADRAADDPGGWRARSRDPLVWKDRGALYALVEAAPGRSVTRLLAVEFAANVGSDIRLDYLRRVHASHPRDFWVNMRLAAMLTDYGPAHEAIGYYQSAVALRPGVLLAHHNLGMLLGDARRYDEALAQLREAARLDPAAGFVRCSHARILLATGRHAEAVSEARAAAGLGLDSALLHTILAKGLEATGRPGEALAELRRAVGVEPGHREAGRELREFLLRRGAADEALSAWAAALASGPADHDDWYGYAELCLFRGREEDYAAARRSLLAKFGASANLLVMERTARACLLRPAAGDDLARLAALAGRVAAVDRGRAPNVYHAFQFVKGLAEYRRGLYDAAISTMGGDAARALGPAPRLVVAMAQYRSGRVADARETLAAAVSAHDWRAGRVRDQDDWIVHVLRREAEGLIAPPTPAPPDGPRRPAATTGGR